MTINSQPQRQPRFVESSASLLFDLVRGLAAVVVLLEHWRNLFFVDFHELPHRGPFLFVLYLISGCGHEAVIVFFLLSGFFIGGSVLGAVRKNKWLTRDYLIRRLVRLWVVLVPALCLCFLWDTIGIRGGHAPALYDGTTVPLMIQNVSATLNAKNFFGNLLFLQEVKVPTFGSDGALWSLAYEFWYYMLFPLGFFALHGKTKVGLRIACGAAFIPIALLVGKAILLYFPIWLAGVLLLSVPAPKLTAQRANLIRILATCLYIPLFLGLSHVTFPYVSLIFVLARDYILTAITFAYLWLLSSARGQIVPGTPSRFCRGIARFSYSLYALHVPFLVLLAAWFVGDHRWLPTQAHLLIALVPLLLAVAYSYGIASVTEFQTDRLRTWIEMKLGWPHPAAALSSDPKQDDIKA